LLSPWILRAYGRNFTSGVWVMVLLVSAAVLSSTVNVIGYAIASLGKMWSSLALSAVWAPVLFSSAWLLVPRYGAMGLAEAVFISYVVHAVLVGAYTWLVLRPGSLAVGRPAASPSL
jgi:O-antigen/teichoic acid export membrane protein